LEKSGEENKHFLCFFLKEGVNRKRKDGKNNKSQKRVFFEKRKTKKEKARKRENQIENS